MTEIHIPNLSEAETAADAEALLAADVRSLVTFTAKDGSVTGAPLSKVLTAKTIGSAKAGTARKTQCLAYVTGAYGSAGFAHVPTAMSAADAIAAIEAADEGTEAEGTESYRRAVSVLSFDLPEGLTADDIAHAAINLGTWTHSRRTESGLLMFTLSDTVRRESGAIVRRSASTVWTPSGNSYRVNATATFTGGNATGRLTIKPTTTL